MSGNVSGTVRVIGIVSTDYYFIIIIKSDKFNVL